MFTSWCLGCGDPVTIYAWSNADYIQITKEVQLKGYELTEAELGLFDTEWSDFQQEFDKNLGFDRQVSLKMALDMAGTLSEDRTQWKDRVFVHPWKERMESSDGV